MRFVKWMLPVVALGLVLGLANRAQAADIKVKGTLVDKDGKAVSGATVNFAKAPARGGGGGAPEVISTAKTNDKGEFELSVDAAKVPDGNYMFASTVEGQRAGQRVTAKDGKLTDRQGNPVETVSLKLGQGGRGGKKGA